MGPKRRKPTFLQSRAIAGTHHHPVVRRNDSPPAARSRPRHTHVTSKAGRSAGTVSVPSYPVRGMARDLARFPTTRFTDCRGQAPRAEGLDLGVVQQLVRSLELIAAASATGRVAYPGRRRISNLDEQAAGVRLLTWRPAPLTDAARAANRRSMVVAPGQFVRGAIR